MKKGPKNTIVNLDFLSGTKLPKINPKDIIGPDHKKCDCICECDRIAVPDSDLCAVCEPTMPLKPFGPPNITIRQGPFISFEFVNKIINKVKGWF